MAKIFNRKSFWLFCQVVYILRVCSPSFVSKELGKAVVIATEVTLCVSSCFRCARPAATSPTATRRCPRTAPRPSTSRRAPGPPRRRRRGGRGPGARGAGRWPPSTWPAASRPSGCPRPAWEAPAEGPTRAGRGRGRGHDDSSGRSSACVSCALEQDLRRESRKPKTKWWTGERIYQITVHTPTPPRRARAGLDEAPRVATRRRRRTLIYRDGRRRR